MRQSTKPTSIISQKWLLIFISFLILMLITFYGYRYFQKKIDKKDYKKDAYATLTELEKLSATLEVGMTYMDYTKRLGEINFPVKKFLDKHQNYNLPTHPVSYQIINNSMDLYLNLAKKWKIAIDANDSYFLSITKEHLGKGWSAIAEHLKLTRQIMEEDDKGNNWSKLANNLIQAQDIWNNEDKDYHDKINKYKDALNYAKQDIEKLNQIIQDIK